MQRICEEDFGVIEVGGLVMPRTYGLGVGFVRDWEPRRTCDFCRDRLLSNLSLAFIVALAACVASALSEG